MTNLIQLGFFITPILYLIDGVKSRALRALLRANPMTPFVVSYQDVVFFGHLPGLADSLLMVVYAGASMAMGLFVFERLRDTLAEAI
jgi:ABC-type polysaccharide/polyol phosphate export permease